MEKDTIVVYGGSFNPANNFHFALAMQVLNQFEKVEKVIFVPVNNRYEKDGLLEDKHRFNMLRLITDKNEKLEVSDIDMNKERSLYTIETLEEIQKIYPDKNICFLIGSDNLKEISTWKRAERLVSKYKILVMERDQDNINCIIKTSELLTSYRKNIYKLSNDIRSNYNSTYIRSQIKKGKDIRYLVPDEIYNYIKEKKIYKE